MHIKIDTMVRPIKKIIFSDKITTLILLSVIIYYNIFANFNYLPITEGWFSAYAELVLQGKVPYRDFYLYLTPLYVWIVVLVKAIFGPSFFVLRIFGLFVICGISLTLFSILKRIFMPAASFAGAVVAVIYYQSGNAHITYDFTQVLTLFALLSIYFLVIAAESIEKKSGDMYSIDQHKACFLYLFSAGIFASCAFLIKQSNGAFIALGALSAFIFLIFSIHQPFLQKIKCTTFFLAGSILPAVFTLLYLYSHDAINPFITQIFFNAIEAKGTLRNILLNWIDGLFTYVLKIQLYEIARILIPLVVMSHILNTILKTSQQFNSFNSFFNSKVREQFVLLAFSTLYISTISYSWNDNALLRNNFFNFGRHLINYIIPLGISWILVSLFATSLHLFCKRVPISIPTSLLAIGTIGIVFGNGTSAGLSEISAFIPLAWTIAWLSNKSSVPFFGIVTALVTCFLLTIALSYAKFDSPYAWWGVSEPNARSSDLTIENPILRGIYMSKATHQTYLSIINELEDNEINGEVFSFPNIPLVYLLVNSWPKSKVLISWFDFLNDADSIAESERLFKNPPDIIVYLQLPIMALDTHERLFRNGSPMGQRKIMDFIELNCVLERGYKIKLIEIITSESTLYVCKKIKPNQDNPNQN